MERLLVIDPGERVGWVRALIHRDQDAAGMHVVGVYNHGITPLKDFALKLHEVAGNYDTIVYETFRIYPGKAKTLVGNDLQTAQLVGMIRLCAWLNPSVRLRSQGANKIKEDGQHRPALVNYIKQNLPEVAAILANAPKSHDDAHDMDALCHLAAYYLERYE